MRTAISAILIVFILSCNKQSKNCEGPNLDCSTIRCVAFLSYFEFKLTDKSTGQDLIFGSNPRYTAADVKLYADIGRARSLMLNFDSNKKLIQTMMAEDEMYLEIKGTDVYKLTTTFKSNDCCSNRVGVLWQDGQKVCSCCPDAITVAVR